MGLLSLIFLDPALSASRLSLFLHIVLSMLAYRNATTLFMATILLMSIAATHAQHASAQTAHAAVTTNIVDANGNRVGRLFEPPTR